MAIGLNSDADFLNRTTNIGDVGHAGITLAGWYYRPSAGATYATASDAAICGVSHSSNGRCIGLRFDNTFGGGTAADPLLRVFDHVDGTAFAGPDQPPFDTWIFYILRSGVALGTITGEWSALGNATWHTQTRTPNGVEDSVQGEVVHIGRRNVGDPETSYGNYAYWHAYSSEIGQAASRALKDASTPQNSPWAFWPLDDNTDTADDSGNGRTLTFNGTITSETSPTLTVVRQFFLIHP